MPLRAASEAGARRIHPGNTVRRSAGGFEKSGSVAIVREPEKISQLTSRIALISLGARTFRPHSAVGAQTFSRFALSADETSALPGFADTLDAARIFR